MDRIEYIEGTISELERAIERLRKGQVWSAYKNVRCARSRLYLVEDNCAHTSVRAAMDWGCSIRLPDGKVYILNHDLSVRK